MTKHYILPSDAFDLYKQWKAEGSPGDWQDYAKAPGTWRQEDGRPPEPTQITDKPGWEVLSWSREVPPFTLSVYGFEHSARWSIRSAGLEHDVSLSGTAGTPLAAAEVAEQVLHRLMTGRVDALSGGSEP